MTMHGRDKMRHSSSWPDRAPHTVRVRVDPLSRAFTIIPTSHETVHRTEQPTRSDYCPEDLVLVGRCAFGDAVAAVKRKLVDARSPASERSTDSRLGHPFDANSETARGTSGKSSGCLMARGLSSSETSVLRRKHNAIVVPFEGNSALRNHSRCKSDSLVIWKTDNAMRMRDKGRTPVSDPDVSKLLPTKQRCAREEDAPGDASSARLTKIESLARTTADASNVTPVAVADERLHVRTSGDARTTCDSKTRETDGARKKRRPSVASCAPSPLPRIKVVNYDDRVTSVSFPSRTSRHACPKCTSESALRSQIDPFRSPSLSGRNDGDDNGGDRCDDSIIREKEGTTLGQRQSKNSWHEKCPIGETERADGRRTEQRQRRSDGSPRSTADLRKEATLRRHYYPEGGWGYVVVTCSVLVHFLGVGLQLAAPGCWHIAAERQFKHPPLHSAGKRSSNTLNCQT